MKKCVWLSQWNNQTCTILKGLSVVIPSTHTIDSHNFVSIDDSFQNVKLLQQFISPQTGMVFDPARTGKSPRDARLRCPSSCCVSFWLTL